MFKEILKLVLKKNNINKTQFAKLIKSSSKSICDDILKGDRKITKVQFEKLCNAIPNVDTKFLTSLFAVEEKHSLLCKEKGKLETKVAKIDVKLQALAQSESKKFESAKKRYTK